VILGRITITLITGANKGLGRETARRLLEIGHTVLIGARDAERGHRTAGELGGASGTMENAVTLPVYPATKAADPGFTGTDFNNRGTQTVTEGTDAIVRLATLPKDGPTGTFQDRNGIVPW
jgi:NAD(P)-dependent dehydrogenase (short-subunit alcohol dehydrogenase family)